MTKTDARRTRKSPDQRREEIVDAACQIALAEGLDRLTLRRIAHELGIASALVNHYFPAVDDLVAAAFGHATARERDAIFAAFGPGQPIVDRIRQLLEALLSPDTDEMSLLWLDGWQATRNRPALRAEVALQMEAWHRQLADLIRDGASEGLLAVDDAMTAAVRIMAMVDGLSVQAALRNAIAYDTVREMFLENAERELGLKPGGLGL